MFNIVNFIVAVFRQLSLFVRTQGLRFELFVEIVHFFERLLVSISAIVEFFFRSILSVVNLLLGFLGFRVSLNARSILMVPILRVPCPKAASGSASIAVR